jgi:hypothetical protein
MNTLRRMTGGFVSLLILGSLLGPVVYAVAAESAPVQRINGRKFSSGNALPGLPPAGRSPHVPPGVGDRSPPMSERPFAQPFVDRGPSIADRPLAPIGGGVQVAPGAAPFHWCQGEWGRADAPPHRCPTQ